MLYGPNNKPLVIERELAYGTGRASISESLGMEWENPDALAREKGLEYYDQVARDPHVQSVWGTRIMALVGCPREIHAASDNALDQQVRDFVAWNLEEYLQRRSLATIARQSFRSATKNGYTVQELIWAQHERGIVLEDVKDRDPERFVIKKDGLYKKRSVWDWDGTLQPKRKYLVEAFDAEYENPYGQSLMSTIHWFVWFKKSGFKFWVLFLEKFGMPTVVAHIPEGFTDTAELDRVRDALDSIQQRTNITVPAGFEVSLLEAARTGNAGAGYDLLVDKCDQQISKAILGQTLTTQEGKDSGSYALGNVHNQVRGDILVADGVWLDTLFNWQLIPVLVDYNYDVQAYPYITSQTQPDADLKAEIEVDEKLVSMGVKLTQKYFYEKYGRPEPIPGEELVGQPTAPAADGLPPRSPAAAGATIFEEKKRTAPADALFESIMKQGARVYRSSYVEPYKKLAEKADTLEAYKAGLKAVQHDHDQFVTLLSNALISSAILGRWVMQQRIREYVEIEQFADDFDGEILYESLTPEQAAQFVAEKGIMGAERYKSLTDEAKRVAFSIAQIEDKRVLEIVQDELERAIREGLTFEQFQEAVDLALDNYGVSEISEWHLETVFRTNVHSAYEQAAYEILSDPDVAPLIQYLQYDAIEDSRTCPLCAALDGVTLPMDDAFWATYWPPNHHRCRCDVIPITHNQAQREGTQPKAAPKTATVTMPNGATKTIDIIPAEGFRSAPTMGGE